MMEREETGVPPADARDERVEEWVRLSREGDEDAFAQLIVLFAPRLQSMIYRMILDWDETRDVAQETFVSAYRALSRYKPGGKFRSWLFRIGARKALDVIRRRGRHPESRVSRSEEESELLDNQGAIDSSIERNELTAAIEEAVAGLSAEQRTAFVMAEYEGFSQQEIAEAMGVTVKSVEMHLYRAKAQLREKMRKYL